MKEITKKIKSSESSISMFLGIVVVIVVGVLLFNYFKRISITKKFGEVGKEQITEVKKEEGPTEEKPKIISLPTNYVVEKGDSLWKISTKFFGDGYNWIDISRENRMKNPNLLLVGQTINIPDVPAKKALSQKTIISQPLTTEPITENTYKVAKGDNLWKISVRAYQDGFKWPEIAKANNLSNPSLIHPENVLVIPR